MRSDRNPYFFLKNSKNLAIKNLLQQAETLTPQEIQNLNIKPDVKKAMLFVSEFGQQQKSQHTAELLALKMSLIPPPPKTQYEIWVYNGANTFVATSKTGSIEVSEKSFFLKDQDKIFINHNWIIPKESKIKILASSMFHSFGGFDTLNILQKNQLDQKYNSTLR